MPITNQIRKGWRQKHRDYVTWGGYPSDQPTKAELRAELAEAARNTAAITIDDLDPTAGEGEV